MKLKVYPKAPAPRHIEQICEVLKAGGIVVLPTDSVYSFACSSDHPDAIKKLAGLKGISVEKANFSFVFSDLSMLASFSKQLSNDAYKLMNRLLPGPFTFILNASSHVGRIIPGKKTIGIRVPDNHVPRELVKALGVPLLTTSVYDDDAILEYTTDPEQIADRWESEVDMVVDGGFGHNEPSTVLDCTGSEVVMIRQGIGELEEVA